MALNYIHHNPVEAGFVEKEEDWLYSSARNYHGLEGLMDVNLLDPGLITRLGKYCRLIKAQVPHAASALLNTCAR